VQGRSSLSGGTEENREFCLLLFLHALESRPFGFRTQKSRNRKGAQGARVSKCTSLRFPAPLQAPTLHILTALFQQACASLSERGPSPREVPEQSDIGTSI